MEAGDLEAVRTHEAYGTLAEIVADAMLASAPGTLITVVDEDGESHLFFVSHWPDA